MDIEEYIESGILELYVYGALTATENEEVSAFLKQHPEVQKEVEEIEEALIQLAAGTASYNPSALYQAIKLKLGTPNKEVKTLKPTQKTPLIVWLSLAASFALLIGLFTLFSKNKELKEQLEVVEAARDAAENDVQFAQNELESTQEMLSLLRSKDLKKVLLSGQQVAPEAYANVYWDQEDNLTYIDAMGLPEPPEGKVYQVWSLKLNPLTPSSIGLLEDFKSDEDKIFKLENTNSSEAFGITLEPAGGSATPTMEQLYTLGAVGV